MLKRLLSALVLLSALLIGTVTNPVASSASSIHHVHSAPWYAPVKALPDQPIIVCILHHESRSTYAHPNLGDNNDPYQYGVFQYDTILWNYWSWQAGVGRKAPGWFRGSTALHAVTIAAYQSTLPQQAKVFAYIVRHDGTWPWTGHNGWAGDGC